MIGIDVDERDSTWERNDPRFRVYVFSRGGSSVRTVDLLDATIEEALDAAGVLSEADEHLWSLALVEQDTRDDRGLIWLSGMDYNDAARTDREWRLRAQMQDRHLRAKVARGQPPRLPNGLRVVRMFPEWSSGSPLWENFTDEYRLSGEDLGLPEPLSAALVAWNETWLSRSEHDAIPEGWVETGDRLFGALQVELADIAEVRPGYAIG